MPNETEVKNEISDGLAEKNNNVEKPDADEPYFTDEEIIENLKIQITHYKEKMLTAKNAEEIRKIQALIDATERMIVRHQKYMDEKSKGHAPSF